MTEKKPCIGPKIIGINISMGIYFRNQVACISGYLLYSGDGILPLITVKFPFMVGHNHRLFSFVDVFCELAASFKIASFTRFTSINVLFSFFSLLFFLIFLLTEAAGGN